MASKKEQFTALHARLRELVGDEEEFDLLVDLHNAGMDCHGYSQLALGEAQTEEGQVQSNWRAIGSQAHYVSQRVLSRHISTVFALSRLYRAATHEVWVQKHRDTKASRRQLVAMRDAISRRHRKQAFSMCAVTLTTFGNDDDAAGLKDVDEVSTDEMIFVDTEHAPESAMFQDFAHATAFAGLYGKSVEASADGIDEVLNPGGRLEQLHWGRGIIERSNGLRAHDLPDLLAELFIYKLWLSVVWSGATAYPGRLSTEWVKTYWPDYVKTGIAEAATQLRELSTGLRSLYELSTVSADG